MLRNPKVGQLVHLNREGLKLIYGSVLGHSHMMTLEMRLTEVDSESMTNDVDTFLVRVDNPEINMFIVDHRCFDLVVKHGRSNER